MKRTADRLFGDNYRWSVLGAGNQMAIAAMSAAMGGHVRVGLRICCGTAPASLRNPMPRQVTRARQIIEGWDWKSPRPTGARNPCPEKPIGSSSDRRTGLAAE